MFPAAGQDAADDKFIEFAPAPAGGRQGDQVAPVIHQIGTVVAEVQVHPGLGGGLAVGDDPDAVGKEVRLGRTLQTGPAQFDLGSGVGHLGAQGKGVDGGGNAKNGVGGDVADAVILGHGAGNGAGDEFCFVDPAVISTDAGIGLVHRAVQESDLGIFHRGLQGGPAHQGRGGEYHLGTFLHGLFNQLGGKLRSIGLKVAFDGDPVTHDLLQMLPAFFVTHDPGAVGSAELVDEGDTQGIHAGGDHPVQQVALVLVLGLGLDLDGVFLGNGDHVCPEGRQGLFQLPGGQAAQILVGIQVQPQKQSFLRQNIVLHLGVDGKECLPEVLEIGAEIFPFRIRPVFAGLLAQMGQ